MCGVFGYCGNKKSKDLIFNGLKRLEYRGYDSWGIAMINNNKIHQYKNIGEIKNDKKLKNLPDGNIGIGHTRWATHGGVTTANAHPHISSDRNFTLVQNGIVENFVELKKELSNKKISFKSETDTEVIVKLIEEETKKKPLREAIVTVFKRLKGRNTIAVLSNMDNKIYAVRNGSPLVLGVAKDGTYIASDTLSFSTATNKAILLDNHDMVEIDNQNISIHNILTNKQKKIQIKEMKHQFSEIDKGKYPHYMLKEIADQKQTLLYATDYTEKDLKPLITSIKKAEKIYVVGAGTAGFAAGQVAYYLRTIANIDARDIRSYEFTSYLPIISKKDLVIALSQSGETADTIEAIEQLKQKGCKVASLVNMYGTTLSRISDLEFYTNSGPEICVASTKVFTSQCAWGYLLSMTVANRYKEGKKNIKNLSKSITSLFNSSTTSHIKNIVKKIKNKQSIFILGKGDNFSIALEGALKIKEISYKHTEGFTAGELKHGIIALIEKDTPVFGIIPASKNTESKDMINAMEQVKARKALSIGIGSKDFSKREVFDEYVIVPDAGDLTNIANVIPFQLISYYLSVALGNNIDKPRNLAKSVTVR